MKHSRCTALIVGSAIACAMSASANAKMFNLDVLSFLSNPPGPDSVSAVLLLQVDPTTDAIVKILASATLPGDYVTDSSIWVPSDGTSYTPKIVALNDPAASAWNYDNTLVGNSLDDAGLMFSYGGYLANVYCSTAASCYFSSNEGSLGTSAYNPGLSFEAAFVQQGTINVTSGVPEPSTWAMLMTGFLGLGLLGFRKYKAIPVSA